jgi:hypothetical protein
MTLRVYEPGMTVPGLFSGPDIPVGHFAKSRLFSAIFKSDWRIQLIQENGYER